MIKDLYAYKIYTKNGFVQENILGQKTALDIGSGNRKLNGAIGIDIDKNSHADIIHDLNYVPWPLESEFFDVILAQHILVLRFIKNLTY